MICVSVLCTGRWWWNGHCVKFNGHSAKFTRLKFFNRVSWVSQKAKKPILSWLQGLKINIRIHNRWINVSCISGAHGLYHISVHFSELYAQSYFLEQKNKKIHHQSKIMIIEKILDPKNEAVILCIERPHLISWSV